MEEGIRIDTPYDIDSTVYLIEKISKENEYPKYKIIKCIVHGFYNFGSGWKIKLRTNRNKFKFMEYDIDFSEAGWKTFESKKEAENRIKEIGGIVVE